MFINKAGLKNTLPKKRTETAKGVTKIRMLFLGCSNTKNYVYFLNAGETGFTNNSDNVSSYNTITDIDLY